MVRLTPGSFVLYGQPPWPAVVCTLDMCPKNMPQPHGYYTLILLIGDPYRFLWALSRDLQDYDPFLAHTDDVLRTEGLRDAWKIADASLAQQNGIDHWKSAISQRLIQIHGAEEDFLEDPTYAASMISDAETYLDFDSDLDQDLKQAIKASLAESVSQNGPTMRSSSSRNLDSTTPRKRKRNSMQASPSERRDVRNHFRRTSFHDTNHGSNQVSINVDVSLTANRAESSNSFVSRQRADKTATSDAYLEDEIEESKEFVELRVGEEQEEFMIPKPAIDTRLCFTSPHLNFLRLKGNNSWSLAHPRLKDISPDDFRFVADYLYSGEFGHRIFETWQDGKPAPEREEGMAECIATWVAAEKLGIVDLLEHIMNKLEQVMPWTVEEVFAFVMIIYQTPGAPVQAYATVKMMLSEYIADRFYDIIATHTDVFVNRMQRFPEMEADVYGKMAERSKQKIEEKEQKEE